MLPLSIPQAVGIFTWANLNNVLPAVSFSVYRKMRIQHVNVNVSSCGTLSKNERCLYKQIFSQYLSCYKRYMCGNLLMQILSTCYHFNLCFIQLCFMAVTVQQSETVDIFCGCALKYQFTYFFIRVSDLITNHPYLFSIFPRTLPLYLALGTLSMSLHLLLHLFSYHLCVILIS